MLRKIINITLYLIAAFVALMAIAMIFAANVNNFKAFVVLIISAAVFLPEVQASINRMVGKNINAIAYIFLGFVLFICGILIAAGTESQVKGSKSPEAIVQDKEAIEVEEDSKDATATRKKEEDIELYQDVVYRMTKDEYPKAYEAWGGEWIERINDSMLPAVRAVDKKRQCDKPVMINLSEQESITQQKAVYFVDCENGRRFYININDVNEGKDIYTDDDVKRRVKREENLRLADCQITIKNSLKNPRSFDIDISTVQHGYDASKELNTVKFRFYAQNGFGAEIANIGKCSFDKAGSVVNIDVQ